MRRGVRGGRVTAPIGWSRWITGLSGHLRCPLPSRGSQLRLNRRSLQCMSAHRCRHREGCSCTARIRSGTRDPNRTPLSTPAWDRRHPPECTGIPQTRAGRRDSRRREQGDYNRTQRRSPCRSRRDTPRRPRPWNNRRPVLWIRWPTTLRSLPRWASPPHHRLGNSMQSRSRCRSCCQHCLWTTSRHGRSSRSVDSCTQGIGEHSGPYACVSQPRARLRIDPMRYWTT